MGSLGPVPPWYPGLASAMVQKVRGYLRSQFWGTPSLRADLKVLITSVARHIIGLRRFVIDHTLLISFSKLPSSMPPF